MWMRIGEKNLPGQTTQHSACVLKPVFTPCVRFRCCCRMPPLLMYFSLSSRSQQQILKNSCFWVANGNVIIIIFISCVYSRAFSYFETIRLAAHSIIFTARIIFGYDPRLFRIFQYVYIELYSLHAKLLFSSIFSMHIYLNEYIFMGVQKRKRDPGGDQ